MDETNQTAVEQSTGDQAADAALTQTGNAAGGASAELLQGATSAQDASGSTGAGEQGNGVVSLAAVMSASDTSLSASNASQGADTGAASPSGAPAETTTDHKSILEKLFEELEGIVHMGKTEIIAVIDRAKALL